MRQTILLFAFLIAVQFSVQGQPSKPIKWSVAAPQVYAVGDTVRIQFSATLEDGWYMYSTDTDSTEYLRPASLRLSSDPSFNAFTEVKSITSKNKYIDVIDSNVRIMEGTAIIEQELIVKKRPLRLDAELEYFVVKDEGENSWVIPYIEKFRL